MLSLRSQTITKRRSLIAAPVVNVKQQEQDICEEEICDEVQQPVMQPPLQPMQGMSVAQKMAFVRQQKLASRQQQPLAAVQPQLQQQHVNHNMAMVSTRLKDRTLLTTPYQRMMMVHSRTCIFCPKSKIRAAKP